MFSLFDVWKVSKASVRFPHRMATADDSVANRSNEYTHQTSFLFPFDRGQTKVIFITDKSTLAPANLYTDVPSFRLSPSEKNQLKKFYDHYFSHAPENVFKQTFMLITDILYDADKNTLYLEVKRVKLILLFAMHNPKYFPKTCRLQKRATFMSPTVSIPMWTTDGRVPLMHEDPPAYIQAPACRALAHLESTLRSIDNQLNFPPSQDNLIIRIAKMTLQDQLVTDTHDFNQDRFSFSTPKLIGLSFTFNSGKPFGGVEFIMSTDVSCRHELLEQVIHENRAPKARPDTGPTYMAQTDSRDRAELMRQLLWTAPRPGIQATWLSALVATILAHNGGTIPQKIPGTRCHTIPLSWLSPGPRQPALLTAPDEELEEENHPFPQ